jgi:hypothetical protein
MEEATASTKEEDGTPTVPPFFLPNVESPAVKDSKDKFKKIYNK